jgi:hypothetical protein
LRADHPVGLIDGASVVERGLQLHSQFLRVADGPLLEDADGSGIGQGFRETHFGRVERPFFPMKGVHRANHVPRAGEEATR